MLTFERYVRWHRSYGEEEGRQALLAFSGEVFNGLQARSFPYRMITPVFKQSDGAGFRNVTIYAKKARGMMLRFILQNRIQDPEHLRAFDQEGYYFNNDLSSENEWLFCR